MAAPQGCNQAAKASSPPLVPLIGTPGLALALAAGALTQNYMCATTLTAALCTGGAFTACLMVTALVGSLMVDRRSSKGSSADSGTEAVQCLSEESLRYSFLPSNGVSNGVIDANGPRASEFESELCAIKALAMHKPTHRQKDLASGEYPYSWHLHGRKRIWEIRLQIRFKTLPKDQLFFGVEMDWHKVHIGPGLRRLQQVLIRTARAVVGNDFHFSRGDDPEECKGELERPCFVMPLSAGATDQFIVSDVGYEPDLAGDLSNLGFRRSDGIKTYVSELSSEMENLSPDKVYTFCLWGAARFVDCVHWELCGLFPGFRCDMRQFLGPPPMYAVIYELQRQGEGREASATFDQRRVLAADEGESQGSDDGRHLPSRKRHFLNAALWSSLVPPPAETLDRLGISEGDVPSAKNPSGDKNPAARAAAALREAFDALCEPLACCTGRA